MTLSIGTIILFYFAAGIGIAAMRDVWEKLFDDADGLHLGSIISTIFFWGFVVVIFPIIWIIENFGLFGFVIMVAALFGFFFYF